MKQHPSEKSTFGIDDLVRIARAQKLLIVSVVLTILQFIPFLLPVVAVLQVFSVIIVARALKISPFGIIARAIGCFIPLINLVVLLELNRRATDALKSAGLQVGLMGVTVKPVTAEAIAAATRGVRA